MLEQVQRHEGELIGVARALHDMLTEHRLRDWMSGPSPEKGCGLLKVAQKLAYHKMYLVFNV